MTTSIKHEPIFYTGSAPIFYISSDTEELKAGFYFINENRQFENEEPFATYEECLEALEDYKRTLK